MLWVENEIHMWPASHLFFPLVDQVLAALVAFQVLSVLKKFCLVLNLTSVMGQKVKLMQTSTLWQEPIRLKLYNFSN